MISWISWIHFWTIGWSYDMPSILIYVKVVDLMLMMKYTFQNTESKSAPWNLSGIPAEASLGPSNVTNSSKPTWPSPVEKGTQTNSVAGVFVHVQQSWRLTRGDKRTVYIESLDDNLQFHLVGHVAQRAHGHPQLLLWDEAVPIPVEHFERLTDLCWKTRVFIDRLHSLTLSNSRLPHLSLFYLNTECLYRIYGHSFPWKTHITNYSTQCIICVGKSWKSLDTNQLAFFL